MKSSGINFTAFFINFKLLGISVVTIIKTMTLPQSFISRTKLILKDEYPEFENALNSVAPTSIRYNNKFEYKDDNEPVKWCESAFYLKERPLFTADPLFHAGAYYVQEASSMFLEKAINQHFKSAQKVLDLCAAPGGKSTLLAQTLLESCLLVSNEIIRSRAYILAENMTKWGNPNIIVSNNQASDFSDLKYFFDAIVIDAPCSGEGMFRKDAGAIDEWSLDNGIENTRRNNVEKEIAIRIGSLEVVPESNFDIILANIFRNTILDLMDAMLQKLSSKGKIIFSGLLGTDQMVIEEALHERNLKIISVLRENDWIAVAAERR